MKASGVLEKVVSTKGFGFIRGDDHKEYFLHRSEFKGFWEDLVNDLNTHPVRLTFTPEKTDKGWRANEASRLDWPNQ